MVDIQLPHSGVSAGTLQYIMAYRGLQVMTVTDNLTTADVNRPKAVFLNVEYKPFFQQSMILERLHNRNIKSYDVYCF